MNIDMDINKVYMVRSAKGIDMLCVDDYLYHYDGPGRADTYRWLCNRRKDKRTPCRSRISTILPDPSDITTHVVHEVLSHHTHERCSDHEITKASKRKADADARGEPSTLLLKRPNRNATFSWTSGNKVRSSNGKGRGINQKNFDLYTTQMDATMPVNTHMDLDFVDKERVFILRRRDGRLMCCVDGQLYYLESKSAKMELYRWACVRKRDVTCTAYVFTEPTIDGTHRLRPNTDSDAHIHPHYSKGKLLHMFQKHNITSVEEHEIEELLDDSEIELFDNDEAVLCDADSIDDLGNQSADTFDTYVDDHESIIIEENEHNESFEYMLNENAVEHYTTTANISKKSLDNESTTKSPNNSFSKWPYGYEVVDKYITPPDHNPLTETDYNKFTFLPSAKGKKVLCMNRYLYHYDSQSKSNGHMFWTCIMRRVRSINCHVRVTMDPTANGPIILRIAGEHNHSISLSDIRKRMKCRERLVQKEQYERIHGQDDESMDNYTYLGDEFYDTLPTTECNDMSRDVHDINDLLLPKTEPPSMIVEYMSDGSNNISAKIEILPTALQGITADTSNLTTTRNNRQQGEIKPQSTTTDESTIKMDLTKICKLRSAKGSELLCVDGFIYHSKNKGLISRSYWVCIKARDPNLNCKSRISTAEQKDGSIRVLRVYNSHSHPVNENDIKRRLYNEINKKSQKKLNFRPGHFIEKSLDEIKNEYGDLAIERLRVTNVHPDVVVHKAPRAPRNNDNSDNDDDIDDDEDIDLDETNAHKSLKYAMKTSLLTDEETIENIETDYEITALETHEDSLIEEISDVMDFDVEQTTYSMKLYAVSDGPPSLAVRMTLKAIDIQYQLINVDFCALEHRSEEYAKMNPQKEIPVLDDDGFFLSESVAIMQYLCDKYSPNSSLYPHDATLRAIINHRLCFNLSFYYAPISAHSMAPIFFDYERTPMSLKKVENALEVFETYLQRTGTRYVASDDLTIADLALVASTLCLEAINFNLSPYPLVSKWYETFKAEYPQLWEIASGGMQEIMEFENNPPDLSHMEHPFHPTRKIAATTKT